MSLKASSGRVNTNENCLDIAEKLELSGQSWKQCYPKILGSPGFQFWQEASKFLKERKEVKTRFSLLAESSRQPCLELFARNMRTFFKA